MHTANKRCVLSDAYLVYTDVIVASLFLQEQHAI